MHGLSSTAYPRTCMTPAIVVESGLGALAALRLPHRAGIGPSRCARDSAGSTGPGNGNCPGDELLQVAVRAGDHSHVGRERIGGAYRPESPFPALQYPQQLHLQPHGLAATCSAGGTDRPISVSASWVPPAPATVIRC